MRSVVFAFAFLLAGCSTGPELNAANNQPAEAPPSPEIIRAAVRAHVKEAFFDPYSIRDAMISGPKWQGALQLGSAGGWTVCLRANAKNRMGGYTGRQETAMTIRGGKVVASLDQAAYFCNGLDYLPFPELTAG